jgi:RNA polymerase sigma-70 factor (ECF subfamily)
MYEGVVSLEVETAEFAAEEASRSIGQPTVASARLSAEQLFRAHARFVAGFVVRLGVEAEAVDDVVQEVFLAAHRRGGFETGPARPTTWLAEIALRVVSTHRRTARRRRVVPDEGALDAAVSSAEGPDRTAEHRDALARVERALETLDVDRRAVFILFEIEGETSEAIAAGLGIPVGTVHSRLHTARKEFQRAFTRLSKEGGSPVRGGELR